MSAATPSPFEVLTSLVLPTIWGASTILLAGAAFVISLFAYRDSRTAAKRSRRAERGERAAQLHELATKSASDIWNGADLTEVMGRLREAGTQLAMVDDKDAPARVLAQLMYWLMYTAQHAPDTRTRQAIATDILFHLSPAIVMYASANEREWTYQRHTIDDR